MFLGTQRVNAHGHLEIGGCDTLALAHEFGTPLYVMDESFLRENIRRYKAAFAARYPGESHVSYAGKAFLVKHMARLVESEGIDIDVASGGELFVALSAGFPAERILFHGNYKSDREIHEGVAAGVGRFVVDNPHELARLAETAAKAGIVQKILLRVTPGIDPHTHAKISTGQEDSKFGVSIQSGEAMEAAKQAIGSPALKLMGIHCHIGSQLLDAQTHLDAADVMVGFLADIQRECGYTCEELDIGGGLGVRYLPEHAPPTYEEFAEVLCGALVASFTKHGITPPRLLQEPGRSLVAEAGTTLYTVGPMKTVKLPGREKTYAVVDGGLSDNPRPALYGSRYSAMVAGRAGQPKDRAYTVSGKHCETDLLFEEMPLGEVRSGDVLAVQTTGAYNQTMASNYNRFLRPTVVFVADGKATVAVNRESYDDLVRQEV
jgi:diaminopimelate decarboxylase